jgi:WhiB family redox-sensing transcriptional regulator
VDTSWMSSGNCRNYPAQQMFPHDLQGVRRARKICAGCPVQSLCLEYAVRNGIEHGVWGGASERQRKLLRQGRKLVAQNSVPSRRSA